MTCKPGDLVGIPYLLALKPKALSVPSALAVQNKNSVIREIRAKK